MYVGVGCALENTLLAAAAHGYKLLPAPGQNTADQIWLKATRETHVGTAAAFGLLAVRDSGDTVQRLLGGRAWQRMHLWATTQGLGMQPLNQLPERADRERQLGIEPRFGNALTALLGDEGWQVLMPFRLGTQRGSGCPVRDVRCPACLSEL